MGVVEAGAFVASDVGEVKYILSGKSEEREMAGDVIGLDNEEIPIEYCAKLIARYADNEELYKKKRSIAQRISKRFGVDEMCRKYEIVYMRAISDSRVNAS